MSKLKSLPILSLLLLMLCSFLLALVCIHPGHNWGGDFALYIDQARALLDGQVDELYQQNKWSNQQSEFEVGPYLYPFGFPLLLAPMYALAGPNFVTLKIYCALFFIFSLPVIFQLFKKHLKEPFLVLLIVAAIAFHHSFLIFTSNVLSDLPFFFFCFLSFLFMENQETKTSAILLGLCITFTWFIRDNGIVLLPTLLVLQVLRHFKSTEKKSIALLAIPYFIFGLFFLLIKWALPAGTENHYSILFNKVTSESISQNTALYFKTLSDFFVGEDGPRFVILLILIFAVLGLVKNKSLWHLGVFSLLTWCLIIIWPSFQGERFLFVILPLLLLFFVKGIQALCTLFKQATLISNLIVAALTLTLCSFTLNKTLEFSQGDTNEAATPNMQAMYAYIQTYTEKQEVIAFFKPQVLRFFTGRNSVLLFPEHFMASPATYYLGEQGDYEKLKEECILVYQSGEYLLLVRKPAN